MSSEITAVETLTVGQTQLQLLPERAVYIETWRALLVSDLHLGKAETFQHYGLPVSSQVNAATLERLEALCVRYRPSSLWILGDLFHGREGLTDGVKDAWLRFLQATQVQAHLIVGNHDRSLQDRLSQLSVAYFVDTVAVAGLVLSHEPREKSEAITICGHIHPCWRLQMGGDRLRLPCFHWQARQHHLILPSFGEFTGGYDITLAAGDIAYVVADEAVVKFGHRQG